MSSKLETKRSKHIDIKYHFVKECVFNDQIRLVDIPTEKQVADVFTKPLTKNKFEFFRDQMNVVKV